MKKRYLAMWMWLCEGKLKVKAAHFRLRSPTQKRACLSFPMLNRVRCVNLRLLQTFVGALQKKKRNSYVPWF